MTTHYLEVSSSTSRSNPTMATRPLNELTDAQIDALEDAAYNRNRAHRIAACLCDYGNCNDSATSIVTLDRGDSRLMCDKHTDVLVYDGNEFRRSWEVCPIGQPGYVHDPAMWAEYFPGQPIATWFA